MGAATLTAPEFVARWRGVCQTERAVAQQHFLDLCALFRHPTPNEIDPSGDTFAFEKKAITPEGKPGFADVWKRDHFTWEYKRPGKSLGQAYRQMLNYRDSLFNPPLLVACDIEHFEIHTNFTGTKPELLRLTNDDLLAPDALRILRATFEKPTLLHPARPRIDVTEPAANRFGELALCIEKRGVEPHRVAHFLTQILFCLFAEDLGFFAIQHTDRTIFSDLLRGSKSTPEAFLPAVTSLFNAMRVGGTHYIYKIPHFNGGLFDVIDPIALRLDEIAELVELADYDWSVINTAVMGTLFQRSLDPEQRAQLGPFYTGRADIERIVEPVVMAPLRREWAALRAQLDTLRQRQDATTPQTELQRRKRRNDQAQQSSLLAGKLLQFKERLSKVRILDPAAGSGNFLAVALSELLDLEKEVIVYGALAGLAYMFPDVSPRQLYGLEINAYAHELSQVSVWITYLQWLHANGFRQDRKPLLQTLDTILLQDALLEIYDPTNPKEPEWPEVDYIIGNPPFLGDKKHRQDLGKDYTMYLRNVYKERVPGAADLVCYFFEKARASVAQGRASRVGLIATNSIRDGASRRVLERIKQSGDIFAAWSNQPWVLKGVAVRISIVCFDSGSGSEHILDGVLVDHINSDLTTGLDLTTAIILAENQEIAYVGVQPSGPFDVAYETAQAWINASPNPNGKSNSEVLRPYINGSDVTGCNGNRWIVDFGPSMSITDAAMYELPFEHVQRNVMPARAERDEVRLRSQWWIYERPRKDMRRALASLRRFIATSMVSSERFYVWLDPAVLPANLLVVFARDDDYFFGFMHSRAHELWAISQGSALGKGDDPRYNIGRCFETFPFPWPLGTEPQQNQHVEKIAGAARNLNEARENWLSEEELPKSAQKGRTLSHLYTERPTWRKHRHDAIDHAVLEAYGWPLNISDDELLARLLALNLKRAGQPFLRAVDPAKEPPIRQAKKARGTAQPPLPELTALDMSLKRDEPVPLPLTPRQAQKRSGAD